MDAAEFDVWFAGVARLDLAQRDRVLSALSAPDAQQVCLVDSASSCATAERVGENTIEAPVIGEARRRRDERLVGNDVVAIGHRKVETTGCPHCASRAIGAWGYSDGLPRYRCKDCRKTFNALTKTPMAGLHKKEQWLKHAEAMIEGTSVAKAADRCSVDYTTAFRWRHRFLASLSLNKPKSMTGIVEGDEMFILESFKGKRSDMPRPPRRRGGKAVKRGLSAEQIPVIVIRDRKGATFDAVLPKLDKASMSAALGGVLTSANTFCCDGGKSIVAFARGAGLAVHVLPAPGSPRPEAPEYHINSVNSYHGRYKEWARRFHGVATKNLPNYLGWRRALEALGSNANPRKWILGTLGLGPYQQISQ